MVRRKIAIVLYDKTKNSYMLFQNQTEYKSFYKNNKSELPKGWSFQNLFIKHKEEMKKGIKIESENFILKRF